MLMSRSKSSAYRIAAALLTALLLAPPLLAGSFLESILGGAMTLMSLERNQGKIGLGVVKEAERKNGAWQNRSALHRVRFIVDEIARAAGVHSRGIPHEVRLIDADDVNAFVTFGNYMVVYRGLLQAMPGEDQLAFVFGHELAHLTLGHLMKSTKKNVIWGSVLQGALGRNPSNYAAVGASVFHNLNSLSYSRKLESEADRWGIYYAYKAGYDPRGALEAMNVLAAHGGGGGPPSWLRSHPTSGDRSRALSAEVARLSQYARPARPRPAPALQPDPPRLVGGRGLPPPAGSAPGQVSEGSGLPEPYPVHSSQKLTGRWKTSEGDRLYLIRTPGGIRIRGTGGPGALWKGMGAFDGRRLDFDWSIEDGPSGKGVLTLSADWSGLTGTLVPKGARGGLVMRYLRDE